MIRSCGPMSFILVYLTLLSAVVYALQQETGFLNRTLKLGSTTYRFQVFVPSKWSKKDEWPVILFLHGAGERGEDGLIQTEVGIGTAVRRHAERFPCIVVFPQCRKNVWWTDPEMQQQALKALEQSIKEFRGDAKRIYLTGISMGGYGTWDMAGKHPEKFAALAPVCGGIRPPSNAPIPPGTPAVNESGDPYAASALKVGKTPVWVFHGAADSVVPVMESRKMVEALKAAGGNVKYSEFEGVPHNSWDKAYADAEFLPWMLSQALK